MKTLITVAALVAAIATPTFVQAAQPSNAVIVGGKVIGADPDANVRFDLQRGEAFQNGGF
jgi:hypothetical protein